MEFYFRRISTSGIAAELGPARVCDQCSRIRILCFFSDFKKHDFLRFFEMTYQKVVKSL